MQCSYIASLQGDMNVLLPSPSFQARVSGVVGDTDNQLGRGMPPD